MVKRKILDKNRSFRKTISIKNFRHWVKSLRQTSKLYFLHPAEKVEQKVVHLKEILALYHFWDLNKNTRQVFQTCTRGVQSEIFKKKLLSSGRNNFLTSLVTRIQKKRLGCKTCLLGSRRTNSTKTCYLKKKTWFPVFFTLSEWLSTELRTTFYVSRRKFSCNTFSGNVRLL